MSTRIDEIYSKLIAFRKERNWGQYHTPKNLAISLSIEAAELLEHFQWINNDEDIPEEKKAELEKEIADVFIYLIMISNDLGIDMLKAAENKIEENKKKYPC